MFIAWFDQFILYTCVEMLHSTLKNVLCANKKKLWHSWLPASHDGMPI